MGLEDAQLQKLISYQSRIPTHITKNDSYEMLYSQLLIVTLAAMITPKKFERNLQRIQRRFMGMQRQCLRTY